MRIKGRPGYDQENLTDDKVYDCLLHIKTSIEMLIEKRERLKDKQVQEEIFQYLTTWNMRQQGLQYISTPNVKGGGSYDKKRGL